MNSKNTSLFIAVFVSLVCILASGNILAQELGFPPCCFESPATGPDIMPAFESVSDGLIAQELGLPPCCFESPATEPEQFTSDDAGMHRS